MDSQQSFIIETLRYDVDRQQRRYDTLTLVLSLLVTVSVGFLAASISDQRDPLFLRIGASTLTVTAISITLSLLFRDVIQYANVGKLTALMVANTQNTAIDYSVDYATALYDAWKNNDVELRAATLIGGLGTVVSLSSIGLSIFLLLG
jgi:hypothetical protein